MTSEHHNNKSPASGFRGLGGTLSIRGNRNNPSLGNLGFSCIAWGLKHSPSSYTNSVQTGHRVSAAHSSPDRHCLIFIMYFDFLNIPQSYRIPYPQETITEAHNYPYVHDYFSYPNQCVM